MRRTRAETASFVIASVKALGLHPHPQSRLMRMHRVLTEGDRIIRPDHPDFETALEAGRDLQVLTDFDTALEAERDLQVLAFVFDTAAAQQNDIEFKRLVKHALKDSVLPQRDRTQSRGRDAQFELFVGAICQSAGLLPVAREEPDVTCTIDGVKFGIAAKRLKNVGNLEKRVRKSATQIENAGFRGIIALDTCVARNRNNKRITTAIPDERFGLLYKRALRRFVDDYGPGIQDWVRGKGVRGIVIHDQQVRFEANGEWSLAGMTFWVPTARENQRRNREASQFWRHYQNGLPNLQCSRLGNTV